MNSDGRKYYCSECDKDYSDDDPLLSEELFCPVCKSILESEMLNSLNEEAQEPVVTLISPPLAATAPDTSNLLYGVRGWLKFFVVMNLYIGPILFGIRQIFAWISYIMIADKYPGIIFVGVIDISVSGYLVVRGIQIAISLRDIRPRAVQNTKTLLRLCLAWTFIGIPINFFSGLDAEDLLPGIVKAVFTGVISFAIWYQYFNVSKRVQATYPDWKD